MAGTPAPGVLEAQCKQNVMETSETFKFFNDFQVFQVAESLTLRFRSESSKAEGALPRSFISDSAGESDDGPHARSGLLARWGSAFRLELSHFP